MLDGSTDVYGDYLPLSGETFSTQREVVEVDLYGGWRPRWYQRGVWDYLCNGGKRAQVIAHRRWGKDEIALRWAATAALDENIGRVGSYWHMLPQYGQARKAVWNQVNPHTGRRWINEVFPLHLREKTLENEMFIRFKNGSTWQLVGSDNYDSLVGAGPAGITISEWALANPASWGYLRPMLVENDGWALFITTPRGMNHAHSMFRSAQQRPDEWYAELSSINDTGQLGLKELAIALREYQDLYGEDAGLFYFQQEYLCDFTAPILGAFYSRDIRRLRERGGVRRIIPVPGVPIHRAWDIGMRDDTSIWWFFVYQGRPYLIDCYTNHGMGMPDYAEVIRSRGWPMQGSVDYVPHDAAVREWGTGKTRMEQMIDEGLRPSLVPSLSKQDGIAATRQMLSRAYIDPRCELTGISALEQYRREWDKERKTFGASEVKDWSVHLADAARYLSVAWRDVPTSIEAPRSVEAPQGSVRIGPPPVAKSGKGRKNWGNS